MIHTIDKIVVTLIVWVILSAITGMTALKDDPKKGFTTTEHFVFAGFWVGILTVIIWSGALLIDFLIRAI